jgi:processive 1,2-diacylglycerol beta-glucosyltransferase
MSKKKVLIAIVDAGNGHRRAAESIDITLQKLYPDQFEVKIMDILKVADVEPFNTSDASYSLVSKNTFLDNINIFVCQVLNLSIPYDLFKSYAVGRLKSAFKDIIDEHNPDLVICNHPVPAMVLGDIRRERDDFKYVINVLDLVTFFRALADRNADLISAPTMNIAEDLVKLGVNLNKVIYPVFPVHPKLKDSTPRDIFLESIGLETSKPVVLITGGGLGSKTLKSAIIKLSKRSDLQLVIIAGRLTYFKN